MKRSYPYTGPQGGQQAPINNAGGTGMASQISSATGADYSGYGYGAPQANSNAGTSANDAQQARWHQQWQQYYAQQAAASSNVGGNPPMQAQPQSQMAPPPQVQGYGYNAGQAAPPMQPQQQSPAAYYGQYSPQQGNVNSTSYGWNQPGYGQPQPPNAYMNAAPQPSAPVQAGYYGVASSPQPGPAAKRARVDNGHGGIPSRPPQGRSMGHGAPPAQRAPSATHHPIPGRPAVPPHAGGPSNMAGPMAGGPSRSFSNNSGQKGTRSQQWQAANRSGGGRNSGGSHSNNSSSSGRFNGPMGVNAVGPAAGMSRPGFGQGQRNQQMRKSGPGSSRNPSGAHAQQQSNKPDRNQNNRGGKGQTATKGPTAEKGAQEDAMEMDKAPLLQGRTTYPAESPVPITAKRTFTDFNIHSIEIDPLQWIWQREDEVEEAEDAVDDDKNSNATDAQEQKKSKRSGRRRSDVKREFYRLRIAFQSNAPPAGAPTGPKALTNGGNEVNTQTPEEHDDGNTENDLTKDVKVEGKEVAENGKSGKADWTPFSRTPPQLSSNRITLSYASAKRRLTIDSNVIKLIEINRAQGTVRIVVDITTSEDSNKTNENQQTDGDKPKAEEWVIAKGVSLEARNDDQGPYFHVSRRELEACWRDRRGSSGEEEEGKQVDETLADEDKEKAGDEEESSVKAEESAKKEEEGEKDGAKEKPSQSVLTDFESLPPLFRLLGSHDGPKDEADEATIQNIRSAGEMTILVTLSDSTAKEAKWIRTGNLSEWLSILPGMQSSISTEPMSSWIGKMYVVDPDPPPTLTDVYDEWVKKSFIATALQRRSFLQDYNLDAGSGLNELIARIVNVQQSDRNPNSINTPTEKELAEPLMEAVKETQFDSHHSHSSLLVWTLTRMLLQSSTLQHEEDGGENKEVETLNRIRDLILSIPMHILFRALDGLCKEAIDKQRLQSTLSRRNKQQQQQQQNQNLNSPSLSKGTHVGVSTNGDNTASIEPSSRSTSVQPVENGSKAVEAAAEQEPMPADESTSVVKEEVSVSDNAIEKDEATMAADTTTEAASSAS
ncbi:uncharacterized protein FA14DRAFT_180862 [Meira miltonrushii]|uniref:Uncharacterized protein n=1 Tax=Meira miltonrushii TaxID=1280837 RepID=A0A316VFI4_9BASI|nr:uncharacterized protein FA14DRAFT_180862 [Meira miltonrushii]PWN34235.1 hypothetical protein FA14DRAFT_180862 [Meira miltonrushii]